VPLFTSPVPYSFDEPIAATEDFGPRQRAD
jgi:hypothetical protein